MPRSRTTRSRTVRGGLALIAATTVAASCSPSGDDSSFASSFSVERGLAELPRLDTDDDGFTIDLVDYVAASEAVGLDPLTADSSTEDVIEWAVQVGNGGPIADGGTGLALPIPQVVDPRGLTTPGALDNEFGWPFGAVTHYAEAARLPQRFSVLAGDLTWRDDLAEVEGGIHTIGEGDDGELATERTDLRPLGRPLRVAERDGLIAASLTTQVAVDWAAATHSTFAEIPGLVGAARALDDRGVFQAVLLRSSFFSVGASLLIDNPTDIEASLEPLIDQPFSTLALGVAHSDDQLQNVVVYVFFTEDSAATAAPQLEKIWTEGISSFTERPFTTLIEDPKLYVDGRMIIVSGAAPETSVGFATYRAAVQGEIPFVHR